MSEWLIRFGLGGVQPFIAESRKLRDFAAASGLFSHTCETVASQLLTDSRRADVILPVTRTERDGQSFKLPGRPHQVTVRAHVDDAGARAIGDFMLRTARETWQSSAAKALKEARKSASLPVAADDHDIDAQLDSALEAYWVAAPIESEAPESYAAAFGALAQAFDDRRHTRTFAQIEALSSDRENWACSQCGARPAVTERRKETAFPVRSRGERLCAVCLTKRYWDKSGPHKNELRFESTHEVARDRYWRDPGLLSVRRATKDLEGRFLRIDDADAEELDAEAAALTRSSIEPRNKVDGKTLGKWLREIDDRCSPYYALVAFDGDKMGEWFSTPDKFKTTLKEAQQALGESLVVFAHRLQQQVDDCGARLVYAGGDDGFVIAPLDSLFPLLRGIHENWKESVSALSGIVTHKPPTLSLHASVVHAKTPLQPALARMQALLKETKRNGDRNAFSILTDVRAGVAALFTAKWDELPHLCRAVMAASTWKPSDRGAFTRRASDPAWPGLYRRLVKHRDERSLPARLLHNLVDAVAPFFDPHSGRIRHERELRNEIVRVASRSGVENVARRYRATFDWLVHRAEGIRRRESGRTVLTGHDSLRSTLQVVLFLARELNWKPLPKQAAEGAPREDDAAVLIV